MPLYNLSCVACKRRVRKLALSLRAALVKTGACTCGASEDAWRWAASGPSTQTMERLDNGVMPRAVERLANAEELRHNRAANSDPLSGGAQSKR